MTAAEMLRRLEPYRGRERTIAAAQDTEDIIRGIERWHEKYRHQYDAVSSFFKVERHERPERSSSVFSKVM